MCSEKDKSKDIPTAGDSKEVLGSKIELDPEVLDYFHNLLLWEEYAQKRNYILIGSRPKCTS